MIVLKFEICKRIWMVEQIISCCILPVISILMLCSIYSFPIGGAYPLRNALAHRLPVIMSDV